MIDASNEVKGLLPRVFWIYNFSWIILGRVLIVNCIVKGLNAFFSGFMGEWVRAWNKHIVQELLCGSCDLFVPCSYSFPHKSHPQKDTHSLNGLISRNELMPIQGLRVVKNSKFVKLEPHVLIVTSKALLKPLCTEIVYQIIKNY